MLNYNNSVFGISSSNTTTNFYLSGLLNVGGGNNGKTTGSDTYFNSRGLKYVMALREAGSGLMSAVSSLSFGAIGKPSAVSSDKDVVSVTGGNNPYAFNAVPAIKVQIDQLAAGQTNDGTALQANDESSVFGLQEFSIETNGRTYQFSINVSAGDTNKDVQQKMATAINIQNIGIDAAVNVNSGEGTSALQLSAQSTGVNAKSIFTISDVSGGAVAETGAANVTRQAQNAIYSINGGAVQTSQSNTVNIGNGVTAVFKQVSIGSVTVSQGRDVDVARNQVESFVQNYNKLYGAALGNAEDPKAGNLASQLRNNAAAYAYSLGQIGIGFDSNGYMQINEGQFGAAVENGKAEQFFTQNRNTNYGFTNQLSRIAEQVQNNTISYISSSVFIESLLGNMNFSFYNSMGALLQNSGSGNTGLLFSFMM